jgi:alkylated DNA repair dioxygenase AlkB
MRIALALDAWLEHEPFFISANESEALRSRLGDELDWEQREIVLFGRPVLQPRLIAWAGDLPYRYSGQTLPARAFTPALGEVLARVRDRVGVPFNHVLLNRYRSGADSMGFHADDEPELGPDPMVAIVSLGVPRRLVVKPRRKGHGPGHAFDLGHGSLLVMGGTCQRHYVHGVPRQPAASGERISLTFRWLRYHVRAPGLRPPAQ